MSEMKERIAAAIHAADKAQPGNYDAMADAVLAAMREPTEAMINAAFEREGQMTYADVWRAMIDEALT